MRVDIYYNICKIIERDSKSSTYKFALLRGVIDIILDNSPFIVFTRDRVSFPTGLLIEKWMAYYYPIFESPTWIPQINGEANLAFIRQFKKIIKAYDSIGGFSAFYNDLKQKGIPKYLHQDFIHLAKRLKDTITRMPMKYIGRSISHEFYSIFQFESGNERINNEEINIQFLINSFGTFSISKDYYDAFQVIGSFINGKNSILFKWAEFSVNASRRSLQIENVLNQVLRSPITEREVADSKNIYRSILESEGKVYCVWTGDPIVRFDIDHMIPFSVWMNNDLWNLLPSKATINKKKRDKIPSVELVKKRKDLIFYYWDLLHKKQTGRFQREIQLALLGNYQASSWQEIAFTHLIDNCNYLITKRGYEEWNI